jgi:hypothetical protein
MAYRADIAVSGFLPLRTDKLRSHPLCAVASAAAFRSSDHFAVVDEFSECAHRERPDPPLVTTDRQPSTTSQPRSHDLGKTKPRRGSGVLLCRDAIGRRGIGG